MIKRPTFFLSSTIYDFLDLRSALKFSLEERGCTVFASEFNDFRVALDKHSYDACLSNVEQSDYFILLVGGRVGGWFDKAQRISITQQEYRTAYDLHKAGTLKILAFVRTEVWQAREDRKALERHLAEMDLEDREREVISAYPSKFFNDAAFMSDFISEIGRNAETTDAVNKGGILPTGNWIHTFSNFRDIQDVLSPLAFSGRTADEAAYSSALQHELLALLARFLVKIKGEPFDVGGFLERHLASAPIRLADREAETINVDAEAWQTFSSLMLHALVQATRAWRIVPEDWRRVEDLFPDAYASAHPEFIGSSGVAVNTIEADRLLEMDVYEVPVYGQVQPVDTTISTLETALAPSRAIPPGTAPYIVGETDGPKHLYILKLEGDIAAYLGRSAQSVEDKLIIKVGFSKSPLTRRDQIQSAYPRGAFRWTVMRPTDLSLPAPYSNARVAIVGEDAMKARLVDEKAEVLGGEFFLAEEWLAHHTWTAGRVAAEEAERVASSGAA